MLMFFVVLLIAMGGLDVYILVFTLLGNFHLELDAPLPPVIQ